MEIYKSRLDLLLEMAINTYNQAAKETDNQELKENLWWIVNTVEAIIEEQKQLEIQDYERRVMNRL
jgi:hypothetical protein